MDDVIAYRLNKVKALAEEICKHLQSEAVDLGFDASELLLRSPDEANYRLEKDPATCEYSLVGEWLDDGGMKLGSLVFHADGSFFVEQDIVRPHPSDSRWFVEVVNAWGRDREIKAEARLLPVPD